MTEELSVDKTLICEECQKEFKVKSDFNQHLLQHACRKPAVHILHTGFSGENILKQYLHTSMNEKSFVCDKCQRLFHKIEHLKCHIRKAHPDEHLLLYDLEKYSICDFKKNRQKAFLWEVDFKQHLPFHEEGKSFTCNKCSKTFLQFKQLSTHVCSHSLFVCEICQKGFSQNISLKKHHLTHTGEKPFVCEVCQKAFSQEANLKRHCLIHTGEKPFVCDICHKSFARLHSLETHHRIHTGEKPYTCDMCQKSFSRGCTLRAHVHRCHMSVETF